MAKAPEIAGLGPDSALGEAVEATLLANVGNVALVLEVADDRSDIEHLHDFRVALRRLRSAMGAYGRLFPDEEWQGIRIETTACFRPTSVLRDIDVQTAHLVEVRDEVPAHAVAGIDLLLADLAARERAAVDDVAAGLARYRDAQVLRRVAECTKAVGRGDVGGGDVTKPARPYARRRVRARARSFAKLLDEAMATATSRRGPKASLTDAEPSTLHALRIGAKKFRYTCELFAPVRPELSPLVTKLTDVQEILGDLQDAEVLERQLLERLELVGVEASTAAGVVYVLADTRARGQAALRLLGREWTEAELRSLIREA